MQLRWVAEAPFEQQVVDLEVNPLDKNMVLCQTAESSIILRCVTHGNKARLVEQQIDTNHGSTTCHVFYCMAFYQGTSDGFICCFDLNGHLLGSQDRNCTLLHTWLKWIRLCMPLNFISSLICSRSPATPAPWPACCCCRGTCCHT